MSAISQGIRTNNKKNRNKVKDLGAGKSTVDDDLTWGTGSNYDDVIKKNANKVIKTDNSGKVDKKNGLWKSFVKTIASSGIDNPYMVGADERAEQVENMANKAVDKARKVVSSAGDVVDKIKKRTAKKDDYPELVMDYPEGIEHLGAIEVTGKKSISSQGKARDKKRDTKKSSGLARGSDKVNVNVLRTKGKAVHVPGGSHRAGTAIKYTGSPKPVRRMKRVGGTDRLPKYEKVKYDPLDESTYIKTKGKPKVRTGSHRFSSGGRPTGQGFGIARFNRGGPAKNRVLY